MVEGLEFNESENSSSKPSQIYDGSERKSISDNSGHGTRERDWDQFSEFEVDENVEKAAEMFAENEVKTDGGVITYSSNSPSRSGYQLENPSEVSWWGEVEGYNEIDAVRNVFEEAAVTTVYGGQDDFVPEEYAFSEEDISAIEGAVDQVYTGDFDQFVDEVMVSNVHPQQSKQLERYNERDAGIPTDFSDYDGFPKVEYGGES